MSAAYSTVTLEAIPAIGYTFSSWSGAVAGTTNPTSLYVNCDKTFTAAFTASARTLYFPHVTTIDSWQTEIGLINTSDQTVTGTLRGLSNAGQPIDAKPITLPARGRRQIIVAKEFANDTSIGYIIFESDSDTIQGYTKFYQEGIYRVAIPAVKEVNTSDLYISHIASSSEWWTGISLVNITSAPKKLTINFSDGQTKEVTLAANEHRAFAIRDLFNHQPQPTIRSGVITNASGIIGLELFGSFFGGRQMEGILLSDKTALTLYYPHVESNGWWTGIVAYNPSNLASTITITTYNSQGSPLSTKTDTIPGKAKYVGNNMELGFPAQTAWFRIDSTRRLCGFELISTNDFEQLAAYAGNGGAGTKAGVFPKIEKYGWTIITLVNTKDSIASVTLTAYTDAGAVVDTQVIPIGGHAKYVGEVPASNATYITYSSDRNIVGAQVNGTADWTMLDGLPGI
ncbi:MAG: InlB B-repeat-containing protein [Syntrophales bacterium]